MTSPAFVGLCLELLESAGPVRARRMFGGHGLYVDGLFVALIANDRLYLKADEVTQADFEAAGCQPFVYASQRGEVALRYWSAPDLALESPAEMLPWTRRAIAAALRARAAAAAASAKARPARKSQASRAARSGVRRTP